jgi:hypothetical protein
MEEEYWFGRDESARAGGDGRGLVVVAGPRPPAPRATSCRTRGGRSFP